MQALIVIPTYNERENIEPLLNSIFQHQDVHVLVVDDNSSDRTYELVEHLLHERYRGRLFLMRRPGKMGLGTAYIEGFRWALDRNYEYIMQMDADFSHDPVYITDFLCEIQNSDVVLGSRYIPGGSTKGWGALRNLISRCGNVYSRIVLGLPFHDLTGGYKCFRADALRRINLDKICSKGYAFQIEMTYNAFTNGCVITEIPITFSDRVRGKSQFSRQIFLEAMTVVWRLRRQTIE